MNVPNLYRSWVAHTAKLIPDFSVFPYEEDKGQQVSSADQVPDDNPAFYNSYSHNHRVLKHGNLTGMVYFHCSVSWSKLKHMKGEYFQWLHANKVFLNQTKFKTDTLVCMRFSCCGTPWIPEEGWSGEGTQDLNLNEELPFQLSSRTVTVPIDQGSHERYSFQAVVIETSAKDAKDA